MGDAPTKATGATFRGNMVAVAALPVALFAASGFGESVSAGVAGTLAAAAVTGGASLIEGRRMGLWIDARALVFRYWVGSETVDVRRVSDVEIGRFRAWHRFDSLIITRDDGKRYRAPTISINAISPISSDRVIISGRGRLPASEVADMLRQQIQRSSA